VQTMSELKPCPFCGGEMFTENVWQNADGVYWQVQCPYCGAMTDWDYGMDRAIKAWNRRAENDR
jgi:Lar family restriction alleviation protein